MALVTTALVAKALGRNGISVDMSADYCRLATWRTTDPGQLARAMRVEKPPAQTAGQGELDLFGDAATTTPTRCAHTAAEQVHNAAGEPVRLLCGCGREWRVLPAEWAVEVVTVAGLEREGGVA